MRKLLLMLSLWIVLLVPVSVQAQGQLHLSLVSVDIWPEYDRTAVLTIYHISLAPDTVLPASLTLRVPLGAEINAVALVDATGNLINAPYDSTTQAPWSVLTITTTSLQVQVEYYTALVKNGITRHITYNWAGDYAVEKLEINFLQPLGAEDPTISLPPVDTSPGQDGLTNYLMEAADLNAGTPFALTIDYQRQTDALSISSLPVHAASTPGPDTPGHVSMTGILPWVLAGIGLLLIVAGIVGFFVWQRGGQVSRAVRLRKPKQPKEGDDAFIYCSQCGKRAQPGDVFCRTCGTRLKRAATD
jgi:zinc-ribbon domain